MQTSGISRQIFKTASVTHHSYHGYEDDDSKSSINKMSMRSNVRMTSLIKLHYTQANDNVHERRICVETQDNLRHAAGILIALCNTESWTGVPITSGTLWKTNGRSIMVSSCVFDNSYSPLWKRVIAWERSRAASGYGIIWGDADRNKQEEFSAECHSVNCF